MVKISDRNRPSTAAAVSAYLRGLIDADDGRCNPLPTEESLAARFGVTRMTVRSAFQQLVSAGMVIRRPGIGTVVAPRVTEDLNAMAYEYFPDRWRAQGVDVTLRTLSSGLATAPDEVCSLFQVAPGSALCQIDRIRYAGRAPIMYDRRYLPPDVIHAISDNDLENESLATVLRRSGTRLRDSEFHIYGRLADDREAECLQIRHDSTVIVRESTMRDTRGSVVMHATSAHPASRVGYRVTMDLRGGAGTVGC